MAAGKLSKTATKPRTIMRKDLDQYVEIRDKRLALEREAAALGRTEQILKEDIKAYVAATAKGKTRSIERCGHRLSLIERPGSPSWLREFTRVAGQDEVDRLRREAPPYEQLQVDVL